MLTLQTYHPDARQKFLASNIDSTTSPHIM